MSKFAVTENEILAAIDACIVQGSGNVMREHERELGFSPIIPGDVPWLPASIWPTDIVVSLDGHRVRIVSIYTLTPGNGQFSRLVTDIVRADLTPTVIAPMGEMVDILERWGWHHRIVGSSFQDRYDEWFPTRKWREKRRLEKMDNLGKSAA